MITPLNQIYYGPPGTGKTFNVSKDALAIIQKSNNPVLNVSDKFKRINDSIRKEYSSETFKAKSNSIYRNDHAIMWMLGHLLDQNIYTNEKQSPDAKNSLTRDEAIEGGCSAKSSNWAQRSQFIKDFRFVDDWKDNINLVLNNSGIHLKNAVRNLYTVKELKEWELDTPQVVRNIYRDVFKNQLLNNFTPTLKTFYSALAMLTDSELYKQKDEGRAPSEDEKNMASKYFDLPDGRDLKWIGHIARIFKGLGISEELASNKEDTRILFKLTTYGEALVNDICTNWESNYPELFQKDLTYEAASSLGYIQFITFHQSYSYEEFIEGIRPTLDDSENLGYELVSGIFKHICEKAKSDRNQNYVLIIDEINRGNVSKIFGELITLIEATKRLYSEPMEDITEVTLPYSKERFSVPNNLYIIGTMNTADRSITNLDTALRRRFSFKEFSPNPQLIPTPAIERNNNIIDLKNVLTVLNQRIEYLLDRDHLIGHSYFMKVKTWDDLCDVFRDSIIPLLQEYFYNDWEKISLVLGESDIFNKSENEKFLLKNKITSQKLFGNDFSDEDRDLYELNKNLTSKKYENLSEQFFIKGFQVSS